MSNINKVEASAGAAWLVGGFTLLRQAPLGLGTLGLIWGLLSLLVIQAMAVQPTVGLLLQLALAICGPLLFAGIVHAVHEVDQGRQAVPAHLLQALQDQRAPRVLATLLPQIAAVLGLGILLLVMIGPSQLQQVLEVSEELQRTAQAGGQPDPDLVRSLPVGRMFLWFLLLLAALLAVSLFTFVAVPAIMLGGRGGLEALRDSFRACVHNLGAMAVFYVLLLITLLALSFAVQLVGVTVQLLAGPAAGMWVANLLLMAVLMPVLAGSVYHAWQQMLGGAAPSSSAPVHTHLEA